MSRIRLGSMKRYIERAAIEDHEGEWDEFFATPEDACAYVFEMEGEDRTAPSEGDIRYVKAIASALRTSSEPIRLDGKFVATLLEVALDAPRRSEMIASERDAIVSRLATD